MNFIEKIVIKKLIKKLKKKFPILSKVNIDEKTLQEIYLKIEFIIHEALERLEKEENA